MDHYRGEPGKDPGKRGFINTSVKKRTNVSKQSFAIRRSINQSVASTSQRRLPVWKKRNGQWGVQRKIRVAKTRGREARGGSEGLGGPSGNVAGDKGILFTAHANLYEREKKAKR